MSSSTLHTAQPQARPWISTSQGALGSWQFPSCFLQSWTPGLKGFSIGEKDPCARERYSSSVFEQG